MYTIVSGGLLLWPLGCGKSLTLGNGNVALSSAPYAAAGVARFANPAVSEFKICVASVKLEDGDGKAHVEQPDGANGQSMKDTKVETNDAAAEIKFSPGLIDLSDGTVKTWGTVKIPTGFMLSKIKVKVKKSKEKCGVDYSVRFNGIQSTEDIEFKWKFNPAVSISANTDELKVSFASVVSALRAAAQAGTLNQMKDQIEAAEDAGEGHELKK